MRAFRASVLERFWELVPLEPSASHRLHSEMVLNQVLETHAIPQSLITLLSIDSDKSQTLAEFCRMQARHDAKHQAQS